MFFQIKINYSIFHSLRSKIAIWNGSNDRKCFSIIQRISDYITLQRVFQKEQELFVWSCICMSHGQSRSRSCNLIRNKWNRSIEMHFKLFKILWTCILWNQPAIWKDSRQFIYHANMLVLQNSWMPIRFILYQYLKVFSSNSDSDLKGKKAIQ